MKLICENEAIGNDKVTLSVDFYRNRMKLKYLLKGKMSRISESFDFECNSFSKAHANLLQVLEHYKTKTEKEKRKLGWLFRVGNGIRDYILVGHLPTEEENDFYIYRVEKKHGEYVFLTDGCCAITISFKALESLTEEISNQSAQNNPVTPPENPRTT